MALTYGGNEGEGGDSLECAPAAAVEVLHHFYAVDIRVVQVGPKALEGAQHGGDEGLLLRAPHFPLVGGLETSV